MLDPTHNDNWIIVRWCYLVGFFAALLVKLDQLVLAGARLNPQVEAAMKYCQKMFQVFEKVKKI